MSAATAATLTASVAARLRHWAFLMRLEYVVFSTVAIVGGLTAQAGYLSWSMLGILFTLNCLVVAFGFIHNDLADEAIDRRARDPGQRPLVAGTVTRNEAWALTGACLAAGVILHVAAIGRMDSLVALLLAYVFAALYNSLGKKMYGSDLLYGASTASVAICGFLAVRETGAESLLDSPLAWAFAVSTFANNCFLNAISGGLKDISYDRQAGVRTFAILTGARVREDGRLIVPGAFRASAWTLRLAALGACWLPVAVGVVTPSLAIWVCLVVGSMATAWTTAKLLHLERWDRDRIGKFARRQEFTSRFLFLFLMFSHADPAICAIIVVVPVICYTVVSLAVHRSAFRNPPSF